ncbi:MAG: hypothetical protein ACR2JS_06840 [Candidatus Nanopelagicales bacterium]
MANADVNRLMDNARIKLPGALDNVLKLEFFALMNEFFQNTSCWLENIQFAVQPTTLTHLQDPDAFTYDIVPDGGAIVRLMFLQNSQGFQQQASMGTPGELVLKYSPNVADTYTATVAKTVTDPTTREGYPEFPDWVLNKYGNEILDGLLGRMMSQVAKPYSSPQLAGYHTKKFQAGVQRAYVETLHGNVYRAQNWSFPQTFARRRRYNGF